MMMIRLCKAKRVIYAHLDLRDLERKLRETRAGVKLIVTDGVFSMDAEVALLIIPKMARFILAS